MAFTREDMAAYEQKPQTQVADNANPFDAPPAAKPPAAKTPVVPAQDPASSADDPASDPADPADGTSDVNADPSTATVDPDNDADPAVVDPEVDDDGVPAITDPPKKGSARERIQELADERDGYKEFGKHLTEQYKILRDENERLKGTTRSEAAPTTPQPAADEMGAMPQLDDAEIDFDPKKLAVKQAEWMRKAINQGVQTALKAVTGQQSAEQVAETFVSRIETFKQSHKDWDIKVRNPALPQLHQAASSVIARLDNGPEILYNIASDIGLAQRIAKMSPEMQAAKVGEITAEIKMKANANSNQTPQGKPVPGAKPVPKKSVSNAPPPPSPTPAGNRSQERDTQDPNLDMNDFARRHREGKNAARAASRKARGLG